MWWSATIESLLDYIDEIHRTTFPDDYKWDTNAPRLPHCYIRDDTEYLESRSEKYKNSKLKHEILTPIRDPISLAIIQACQ